MKLSKAKDLLGLRDAFTGSELKRAYRKKVFECHPDRFMGAQEKLKAHKTFLDLQKAYSLCGPLALSSHISNEAPDVKSKKEESTVSEEEYLPLQEEFEKSLEGSFAGRVFHLGASLTRSLDQLNKNPFWETVFSVVLLPMMMGFGFMATITYATNGFIYEYGFQLKDDFRLASAAKKAPALVWVKPLGWCLSISLVFILKTFYFNPDTSDWPLYRLALRYLFFTGVLVPAFIFLLLETTASYRSYLYLRRYKLGAGIQ